MKLYGVIDSVCGKKTILGGHSDTIDKLKRCPNQGKSPLLEGNKFCIYTAVPISPDMVGEKVVAHAYVKKYKFMSTYEHNKDELIQGWTLYASKVIEDRDWS